MWQHFPALQPLWDTRKTRRDSVALRRPAWILGAPRFWTAGDSGSGWCHDGSAASTWDSAFWQEADFFFNSVSSLSVTWEQCLKLFFLHSFKKSWSSFKPNIKNSVSEPLHLRSFQMDEILHNVRSAPWKMSFLGMSWLGVLRFRTQSRCFIESTKFPCSSGKGKFVSLALLNEWMISRGPAGPKTGKTSCTRLSS